MRCIKPTGHRLKPGDITDMAQNVRYHNGNRRRKMRARFKAMDAPCGICKGQFGPIHYDEPSNSEHPLSFVIDEIIPVSRAKQFGYDSAASCVDDFNNLQAAHWMCNAKKGNKIGFRFRKTNQIENVSDGSW